MLIERIDQGIKNLELENSFSEIEQHVERTRLLACIQKEEKRQKLQNHITQIRIYLDLRLTLHVFISCKLQRALFLLKKNIFKLHLAVSVRSNIVPLCIDQYK